MLERAQRQQPQNPMITWQATNAQDLPFDDGSFDVVLCQFGAMFFPDRVRAYSEARRVLRPGGRFILNIWDRIERNEFADTVTEAAARIFPDDPPRFLARTPHGHGDPDRMQAELEAAGFAAIGIEEIEAESRAPSARHPAIAYAEGTPLRNEIEERDAARLTDVTDHAESMITERFGAGPVSGLIRAFVATAIR
jgi:SAM-dependent methyltransferase